MSRRTHRVRCTRWPDRVIEVDDATLLDLTRGGQLLPLEDETAPAPEHAAVEVQPEAVEVSEPEAPLAPAANPPASGRRHKRAAAERRPTTPPAPE